MLFFRLFLPAIGFPGGVSFRKVSPMLCSRALLFSPKVLKRWSLIEWSQVLSPPMLLPEPFSPFLLLSLLDSPWYSAWVLISTNFLETSSWKTVLGGLLGLRCEEPSWPQVPSALALCTSWWAPAGPLGSLRASRRALPASCTLSGTALPLGFQCPGLVTQWVVGIILVFGLCRPGSCSQFSCGAEMET